MFPLTPLDSGMTGEGEEGWNRRDRRHRNVIAEIGNRELGADGKRKRELRDDSGDHSGVTRGKPFRILIDVWEGGAIYNFATAQWR